MLPASLRMRRSSEFRLVVRRGVRSARGAVVVHAYRIEPDGIRIGLVVSKAVGTATTRNRVKRRLRHAAAQLVPGTTAGARLVIRALPAAATSSDLGQDLAAAWCQCLTKLDAHRAVAP